jgi:hypothetical protein
LSSIVIAAVAVFVLQFVVRKVSADATQFVTIALNVLTLGALALAFAGARSLVEPERPAERVPQPGRLPCRIRREHALAEPALGDQRVLVLRQPPALG